MAKKAMINKELRREELAAKGQYDYVPEMALIHD